MDSVNVMVVASISQKCLEQISSVSPVIKLYDASEMWNGSDVTFSHSKEEECSSEQFNMLLAEAEVIYGYRPPQNLLARAPKLKWFQTMLAGVDHILNKDIVKSKLVVTNVSGIHATPVSEFAFSMMIMLAKQVPFFFRNQQEKLWKRFDPELLSCKTVGIVGLGSIGREFARLSKAFGMKVLATRRSAKLGQHSRNVDKLLPITHLLELLAESDFVVLFLPGTPETNKIIGEKELRAMKSTAYLVNVGRGNTIDENILIHALEEGWIAGAGLDTCTVEPLPVDSKLWGLSNVILSPHISGKMVNYAEVANDVFCDNLRRYISGKRLRNTVNKKLGY